MKFAIISHKSCLGDKCDMELQTPYFASNLDLCLLSVWIYVYFQLLLVLPWSAAISFVHNSALVSFLTNYFYTGLV